MRFKRLIACVLLTFTGCAASFAQTIAQPVEPATQQAEPATQPIEAATQQTKAEGQYVSPLVRQLPRVSLLTVGPGKQMYQLEGHSALRLLYPDGSDYVINWGVFDFNSPGFAFRFLKGDTDYYCAISTWEVFLMEYQGRERSICEQVINLSDTETRNLVTYIDENLRPGNCTYRYNYVLDNCATRPFNMLERAISSDGAVLQIEMPQEQTSFRGEMRGYHSRYPWYQLFIDMALGSGIDYQINPRQQAFAPIYLSQLVKNSYIVDADGVERPMTLSKTVIMPEPAQPHSEGGVPPILVVGLILALSIAISDYDWRRNRLSRWFDTIFYLLLGLLGLLLTFLVFVSTHEATSPNINYLWINPLCLLVPILLWSRRGRAVVGWYQLLNLLLIAIYILGNPFFHQSVGYLLPMLALADAARAVAYLHVYPPHRLVASAVRSVDSEPTSKAKNGSSNKNGINQHISKKKTR